MTVKELIKEFEKFDGDIQVCLDVMEDIDMLREVVLESHDFPFTAETWTEKEQDRWYDDYPLRDSKTTHPLDLDGGELAEKGIKRCLTLAS